MQLQEKCYISELLMTNSVAVEGEFLLEWCEYFGQPQVWYISYVALLAVVHQLCNTVCTFDLRCESVTYAYV